MTQPKRDDFPVGSIRVSNSHSNDTLVVPFQNDRVRLRVSARAGKADFYSVEIEFSRHGRVRSVEVNGKVVYGVGLPVVSVAPGAINDLPKWVRKLVGEKGVRIS